MGRIYPLFLTVLGLYIALSVLFPASSKLPTDNTQALIHILQNAALMPGLFPIRPIISVAWTLSFIVLFYLVVPLYIQAARLRHRTCAQRIAVNLAMLACGSEFARLTHLVPLRINMLTVGILLAEIADRRTQQPAPLLDSPNHARRRAPWDSSPLRHRPKRPPLGLAATPLLTAATGSTAAFWTIQPLLFGFSLIPCIALHQLIEQRKLLYWMTSFRIESLTVRVFQNRRQLGEAAADAAAQVLRTPVSAFFAAAPSQNETLEALAQTPGVDWANLNAFHLDEYAGATADASHSFRRYLREHLFNLVPRVARFEGLRGEAVDLTAETERYSALLEQSYPTVGLIGIGENGHIAFNDPPAARFDDPKLVRVVKLTEACRRQQVNDQTFPSFDAVPEAALSVTIPALMQVAELFVMVPGKLKAEAVRATLQGPVTEACPASILRTHPKAILFLDQDSASLL